MRHTLRWASIALVALIALGAVSYALARSDSSTSTQDRTDSAARREALSLWRGFSAQRKPRPLILTGQGRIEFPVSGFPNRADEAAFLTGRYRLRAALPTAPATSDGYQVLSAAAAYRSMRHPIPGHRARPHGRLTVRAVHFGHARFKTDRGRQLLPAWLFSFVGVRDPAKVLAVRSSAVFTSPRSRKLQDDASPYPDDGATIALDDRTITLSFQGAPAGSGPCEANYTIASTPNRDAVALTIIDHPGAAPAGHVCLDGAYARTATIRLVQPLGARALISSNYATVITVRKQNPKRLTVADAIKDPVRTERAALGRYCLPSRPGVQRGPPPPPPPAQGCRHAATRRLIPHRQANCPPAPATS